MLRSSSNGFDLGDDLPLDDLEFTFSPKTMGADGEIFSDLFDSDSIRPESLADTGFSLPPAASMPIPPASLPIKIKEEPVDNFEDLPLISNISADEWLADTLPMSEYVDQYGNEDSTIPQDYKDPMYYTAPAAAPPAPTTRSHYNTRSRQPTIPDSTPSLPAPLNSSSRRSATAATRQNKRKLENLDYSPDSARRSTEEALALLEKAIPETVEDEKELKKQRRLLKNREAAHLSRLRKKAYVEDLEAKAETLASENSAIKARLQQLEVENMQLKEHIKRMSSVPTVVAPALGYTAACR